MKRPSPPKGVTFFLSTFVVLIAGTLVAAFWSRTPPALTALRNTTDIIFDLDRTPLTRTAVIDVCGFADVPERCAATAPSADAGAVGGTAPADRPAVRSVMFVSDLDGQTCLRMAQEQKVAGDALAAGTVAAADQFPAAQVKTSAELVGRTGLAMTFTADPGSPESVRPGVYCGMVNVERDRGSITHGVRVVLANRGAVLPLVTAILFLVLGSVIGIAIRLGNDPISRLIPIRRRQRSVQRRVAALEAGGEHPDEVAALKLGLDDVADAIATMDVGDATARLDKLEALLIATVDKPDAGVSAAVVEQVRTDRRAPDRPLTGSASIPWVVDRYWVLASVLIVIVVTVSGLKTQYLDVVDLSDDIEHWLALAIFGLAFQITASTIAEAAGKLTPSSSQSP